MKLWDYLEDRLKEINERAVPVNLQAKGKLGDEAYSTKITVQYGNKTYDVHVNVGGFVNVNATKFLEQRAKGSFIGNILVIEDKKVLQFLKRVFDNIVDEHPEIFKGAELTTTPYADPINFADYGHLIIDDGVELVVDGTGNIDLKPDRKNFNIKMNKILVQGIK